MLVKYKTNYLNIENENSSLRDFSSAVLVSSQRHFTEQSREPSISPPFYDYLGRLHEDSQFADPQM